MKRHDFSWMIGGVQGSGVDTSANVFARAAAMGGLFVFGKREYYSNIKGEHSYFQVRVSKSLIRSHVDTVDMLTTFEEETIFRHALEVRKEGAIIYDPDQDTKRLDEVPTIEANVKTTLIDELAKAGLSADVKGILELARRRGVHIYPIPYTELLKAVGAKFGETSLSTLQRMLNVMAVAASFALVSYDENLVKEALRKQFRSKPKVVEMNVAAVGVAYEYMKQKYAGSFAYKLEPVKTDEDQALRQGQLHRRHGQGARGLQAPDLLPNHAGQRRERVPRVHAEIQLDGSAAREPADRRSRGPEEQGRHRSRPVGGRDRGNHDGDRRRKVGQKATADHRRRHRRPVHRHDHLDLQPARLVELVGRFVEHGRVHGRPWPHSLPTRQVGHDRHAQGHDRVAQQRAASAYERGDRHVHGVVRARDDERHAGLPPGHHRHGDFVAHPDHQRPHGR